MDFSDELYELIAERVDRFEQMPLAEMDLRDLLDGVPDSHRKAVLLELVLTDWERWETAGFPQSSSDYVSRYPELDFDDAHVKLEDFESKLRTLEGIPSGQGEIATQDFDSAPTSRSDFRVHETEREVVAERYELLKHLGSGGFGEVWKAKDLKLDRLVAIKFSTQANQSNDHRSRFFREAKAAAKLEHPNVVPIYDHGEDGRRLYIVFSYIEGGDLSGTLPADDLGSEVEMLCQVLEGLEHAHGNKVVHRDLKPANIMIATDRSPLIMDFGLARTEGDETLTRDDALLGTPAYMSPEQARGESKTADHRADIYSMGVILFERLTSERPFRGKTRELLSQVVTRDPPSPRRFNASLSKDLETICLKCLEKDPSRRYQTAKELREELERWQEGVPILARPISSVERAYRWCRRNWIVTSASAAVFSITLVALVVVTLAYTREQAALAAEQQAHDETRHWYAESVRAVDTMMTSFSDVLKFYPYSQAPREFVLREAADYYGQLADASPESSHLRVEQARASIRHGDVQRSLQQVDLAQQSYQQAYAVLDEQRRQDVANPDVMIELAVSAMKLGIVHAIQGELAAAEKGYLEAESILHDLDETLRGTDDFLDAHGSILLNLSALLANTGRAEDAKRRLQDVQRVLEGLSDRKTHRRLEGLATAHELLGGIFSDEGELENAAEQLKHAQLILQELIDLQPNNPGYLERHADVAFYLVGIYRRRGERTRELRTHKAIENDYRILLESLPGVPEYEQKRTLAIVNRAQLESEIGRTSVAVKLVQGCLPDLELLQQKNPLSVEIRRLTALTRLTLSSVLCERGSFDEAESNCVEAQAVYETLLQSGRATTDDQLRLVECLLWRATIAFGNDALDDSLKITTSAIQALAQQENLRPDLRNLLAELHRLEADIYRQQGRTDMARASLGNAGSHWTKLLTGQPIATHLHAFSSMLTLESEASDVELDLARQLSRDAIELSPANESFLAGLGAVHLRKQELAEAIKTLAEAESLSADGDGRTLLFLALAFAQQKDIVEARRYLKLASRWIAANKAGIEISFA